MKKSTSQETSVTETKKKTKKKKKSKMNIFKTETAHTTTMPIKTKPVSSVNTFTTFIPEYCASRRLAVYISLPEEPNTIPVIEKALLDGKSIFVPQIMFSASDDSPPMCMRHVKSLKEIESWRSNKWGIKEPEPVSYVEQLDEITSQGGLDLFVVPGLAFTRSGHRLGRGGGYYDRYIQWYTGQCHLGTFQRAKLVAFAFEEQIIDHIPSETHDLIIDQLFVA
ncbi:5-formyltetrahydrofolate cyclo-ligase [Schistosoma bovis]|uniref:5-formyltetrahydrofolate cyclo-ligase n=1 Tax=Schistosoma bovis TaxID=6184 RepID=A0A430QBK2_SCHBO|nr:5-formyltetrahydrofolate cyclo-ligase [Schistosoma bovis]